MHAAESQLRVRTVTNARQTVAVQARRRTLCRDRFGLGTRGSGHTGAVGVHDGRVTFRALRLDDDKPSGPQGRKRGCIDGTQTLLTAAAALCSCAALSASIAADSAGAASKPSTTLTILVTNDDGVTAPGINATVQALSALPHTKVTVVAPLTNQSGTGAKVTGGTLTVTDATTASGYPAKAVAGYPADTIIWAIDDHGIAQRPDLVVSGINFGENIGPLASLSGTVGAAQTALARGIPALAVSQGVDNGQSPELLSGRQVPGGLGAGTPQGSAGGEEGHRLERQRQSQRADLRHGPYPWAGQRQAGHHA